MKKNLNSKAQSGIAAAIISLIVLTSSAILVGNLTITGSIIDEGNFNSVLEETIEIEVWMNTIISIENNNGIEVYLKLDNGTILPDKKLTVEINQTILVTEKINSQGYTKPNFNLYNASPGIYSVQVDFWGLPSQYLNPSSAEIQIKIQENGTIEILTEDMEISKEKIEIIEKELEIPETNITIESNGTLEINSTNETLPSNLICEEFTEQVLWSSGYSLEEFGSLNYEIWYPKHNCSDLKVSDCFIENIKVKTRFLSFGGKNQEAEGYVQISESEKSTCNSPKKGEYLQYLANEHLLGEEQKNKDYCGKNENCEIKNFVDKKYIDCYGIKIYGGQYVITDVFEISYNLCYLEGGKNEN